ncbi:50S ribosomal protein L21 [Arsenicitalea aurantiaca]|uniref:Large ribosomal subunit protein bL21 n=1 Tax=Arsenicitalea aurantiaca TaxID=1783274 RepID=A0A433X7H0_9HYPH|nr:50S ribosomal protein L21 [Arsenicitalea aurantiaca]RUT30002.1 50S ribosomal protein L21 [Arsenicitalea aurantiaca]
MNFAVIKTGGKQYKVAANDVLKIEKLEAEAGDIVTFDQVLMVGTGADVTVGAPLVEGALVAAELVETKKQRTVIIFKKNRRHNYRRRNGHRQLLTTVRITEILTGGAQPSKTAPARKAAAKAETTDTVTAAPAEKPAKKTETKAKADAPAAEGFKDDVKLIGGVGPALEKKLAGLGITSLRQIAEFDADEIARVDAELNFKGRIEREEWVAQAKDLIAGKPPRAKADQDKK